jgi:hypothetical protein
MSIEETLAQREEQHGSFFTHCILENELRCMMEANGQDLDSVQMVGLGMIMHKIARILNNGHNHIDSWHDIAGYATLVEKYMRNEQMES